MRNKAIKFLMRYCLIILVLFLFSLLRLSAQTRPHINQENRGNQNVNIISQGDYTTSIGKLSYNSYSISRTVKVVRPDFAVYKILVNTKSKVYEDVKLLGTSTTQQPLRLNLRKGIHNLIIRSEHYRGFEFNVTVNVLNDHIDTENNLNFKFEFRNPGVLQPIMNKPNGLYGYFNIETKELAIDFQFSDANHFYRGIAAVEKNGMWGYIDPTEKLVYDYKYSYAGDFGIAGIAFAQQNGNWAVITMDGKVLFDLQEFDIDRIEKDDGYLENFYAFFKEKGKEGLIAINGKVLVSPKFTSLSVDYNEKLHSYLVRGENSTLEEMPDLSVRSVRDHKYGYFNKEWQQVLPIKYDEIIYEGLPEQYVGKGTFIVKSDGKYQLLDSQGRFVSFVSFPYDDKSSITSDLFLVEKNGKYGCVNAAMKEVLAPQYDNIMLEMELLKVDSAEKSGYFNLSGIQLLPFIYDSQWDDLGYYKLIVVSKEEKQGLIDYSGNEVLPCEYDEILLSESSNHTIYSNATNYAKVRKGKKLGIINDKGKFITSIVFDEVEGFRFGNSFSIVRQNKQYGIVNKDGSFIPFRWSFSNVEAISGNLIRATFANKYIYFDRNLNCKYGCITSK